MSLSITRLPTHWNADEAYTVIAFLDLLRDQLMESYGDEITAMLREAATTHTDDRQIEIALDDEIDF